MLDSRAYTEVNAIISALSIHKRNKIPEKVRANIKQKMDKSYVFTIDCNDIKNTILLEDTKKILSVLYVDYFSTYAEREIATKIEKDRYLKEEQLKLKRFPIDVFEKRIKKYRGNG
ncbi:MAG: hypothetical protein J6J36_04925 [Clostridia bacterium]|nr:hypothetical protein [Clostridia bacterium]